MGLTIFLVLIMTMVQFVVGAIWYGTLFGKLWGKIHGFDKLSKEVQKKMMAEMGPYYGLQLLVTVLTSVVLVKFRNYVSGEPNVFWMVGLLWLGLVMPAQVSAVIFGGTDKKWLMKKILVQAGGSFACLQAAAIVLFLA